MVTCAVIKCDSSAVIPVMIIIPPNARIIVRLCPKHAYFIDEEPVNLQVLS